MNERTAQLKQIKDEVIALTTSPLYANRIATKAFPVIGEGNHFAEIMFVGEAPGRNEAATGRPFCGAAGKILDDMLASIAIDRASVYVTNIVKDRPPMNRDPLPEEIASYGPFLDRQIEIIQPNVIATLGRYAMRYILEKFSRPEAELSITKLHGNPITATAPYGPVTIFPLYHPAATIYNRELLDTLIADFAELKNHTRQS